MVKQGKIDEFSEKKSSKPSQKLYDTNKAVVKLIDYTCSSDLVDLIDYGIINRG